MPLLLATRHKVLLPYQFFVAMLFANIVVSPVYYFHEVLQSQHLARSPETRIRIIVQSTWRTPIIVLLSNPRVVLPITFATMISL